MRVVGSACVGWGGEVLRRMAMCPHPHPTRSPAEVFNNAILAKRGDDTAAAATAAGGGRVPDATSVVAVFYVSHPAPHTARLPRTPTAASTAAAVGAAEAERKEGSELVH
jgi:hypothetical protein